MKKSYKNKLITHFGSDSLFETKIEYFDTVALENKIFSEECKKNFHVELNKVLKEFNSNVKQDTVKGQRENLLFQIESYLMQYYHDASNQIVTQYKVNQDKDNLSYLQFLKTLGRKDAIEIRSQINKSVIPYILSIIKIFNSILLKSDLSDVLSENESLKNQLIKYAVFDRRKYPMDPGIFEGAYKRHFTEKLIKKHKIKYSFIDALDDEITERNHDFKDDNFDEMEIRFRQWRSNHPEIKKVIESMVKSELAKK